jgi:hypothetical protein
MATETTGGAIEQILDAALGYQRIFTARASPDLYAEIMPYPFGHLFQTSFKALTAL